MRPPVLILLLSILLIAAIILASGIGALPVAPGKVLSILLHQLGLQNGEGFTVQEEAVITAIRLPRVFFALLIGATLSVCGGAMQGLFRNPLADPGLVGISSGAAMAAVIAIVLTTSVFSGMQAQFGIYALSLFTFAGAFVTAMVVYKLSQSKGRTIVSTMLLAGIAISALTSSVTGFITLSATDAQLRTITFWTLGSLGGANWTNLMALLPLSLLCIIGLPLMAKPLNAFTLGETNALHLGIRIESLKLKVILLTALGVGACVSVSGVIGFVGLVVPHIIRKLIGPEHKNLFIASALLGALLLLVADLLCRTIIAPVEIPIGILTAFIGAPFFLYLLIKERNRMEEG
ncbi:MAG TPA: iron ABC transporter permease [Chitinophagaceae bacterium]|nr:iron ABC transporter permease [Chitinophagaceae bacterium]